jgi:lipopolysaccharide export LptBFGC system permease protein LptF
MTNDNKDAKPTKKRKPLPLWARIMIRTARILLVPVLCLAALFIGMTIGYVRIGDGATADLFQIDTWRHLFDLIFKETAE